MTQKSLTSKTEVSTEVKRPPKTILVVYRKISISHNIEIRGGGDRWMFLALDRVHYGCIGYSLDAVFLMDGITQDEFVNDSGYTQIYPNLRPEAVILEAG